MSESESETTPVAPSESKTVEERLAYLEEQNEGFKRAGGLLLALVVIMGVSLIVTSRSLGSAVNSESLILSSGGRPRAALTAMPNGHVGMLFYNFAGLLPSSASYNSVPPLDGIVLYDQSGRPRILLGVDDKNMPVLAVLGLDGKPIYSAITQEQYKQLLEQEAAAAQAGQPPSGIPGGQTAPGTPGSVVPGPGGTGSAIPAPGNPGNTGSAIPAPVTPGSAGSAIPAPANIPAPASTPSR